MTRLKEIKQGSWGGENCFVSKRAKGNRDIEVMRAKTVILHCWFVWTAFPPSFILDNRSKSQSSSSMLERLVEEQ